MSLAIPALPASVIVKEATQKLHSEVEAMLLPKLSSIKNVADYAAILRTFYGYYYPLESSIGQFITPSCLPDINERRKAVAILHDLNGIENSSTEIPLCTDLPKIGNTNHALGALYVLEGSTLGGKMIARMLLKNSAVPIPEEALTFFSGYREETGSKWKAFLQVLNQQEETDAIVKAANETFYYLKGWMQHTLSND